MKQNDRFVFEHIDDLNESISEDSAYRLSETIQYYIQPILDLEQRMKHL